MVSSNFPSAGLAHDSLSAAYEMLAGLVEIKRPAPRLDRPLARGNSSALALTNRALTRLRPSAQISNRQSALANAGRDARFSGIEQLCEWSHAAAAYQHRAPQAIDYDSTASPKMLHLGLLPARSSFEVSPYQPRECAREIAPRGGLESVTERFPLSPRHGGSCS